MPWMEILMLAVGVALIVTMICTGQRAKQGKCGAWPSSRGLAPQLRPSHPSQVVPLSTARILPNGRRPLIREVGVRQTCPATRSPSHAGAGAKPVACADDRAKRALASLFRPNVQRVSMFQNGRSLAVSRAANNQKSGPHYPAHLSRREVFCVKEISRWAFIKSLGAAETTAQNMTLRAAFQVAAIWFPNFAISAT
jgi:hypothetical protein